MSESVENQRTDQWMNFESKSSDTDLTVDEILSSYDATELSHVEEVVKEELDARSWKVIESILSVHATHLLDGTKSCFGLIIEGPSGCGKTTCLRPLERVESQFYRSDDITPASFVSHDSSKTEEELQKQDLLPRIKNKTVLNPEMANWFSGDYGTRKSKMSRMVRVMDGDGLITDSGTHGKRGYEGKFRFNFIGATTLLDNKDWKMMGHTGNRFLFHQMSSGDSVRDLKETVFGQREYGEKIDVVADALYDYIIELWQTHDGLAGVTWPSELSDSVIEKLVFLGRLVAHARAPLNNDNNPERENPRRVIAMLRDLARGRALLQNRKSIQADELEVCSRVALSTMPHKRRGLIRELVQMNAQNCLRTSDVESLLDVSKPTAQSRMETIDSLDIGQLETKTVQGGRAQVISINPELSWPDNLEFPDLEHIN